MAPTDPAYRATRAAQTRRALTQTAFALISIRNTWRQWWADRPRPPRS